MASSLTSWQSQIVGEESDLKGWQMFCAKSSWHIGIGSDRSASSIPHSGRQSDSMKDSKQEELLEEEGRWVESQILPLAETASPRTIEPDPHHQFRDVGFPNTLRIDRWISIVLTRKTQPPRFADNRRRDPQD